MSTHKLGATYLVPVGEGRTFRIAGIDVAVFRTREGSVHATQARCPHKGGPLSDGMVAAGAVVCPLHARTFDLATGAAKAADCAALRTHPAFEKDGELFVELTSEARSCVR